MSLVRHPYKSESIYFHLVIQLEREVSLRPIDEVAASKVLAAEELVTSVSCGAEKNGSSLCQWIAMRRYHRAITQI